MPRKKAVFKNGVSVTWRSQAGGVWTTKRGKIVATVPKGKPLYMVTNRVQGDFSVRKLLASDDPYRYRDHASYLVAVPGSKKSTPQVYWPLVKKLKVSTKEVKV